MSRPGLGRRRKGSNKVRGLLRGILLAIIVCNIVWVGFNYVRGLLRTNMVDVELAKYGIIQETVSLEGILVRDETVLTVPTGGKLEIVAPEGERVRVGALIAKVKTPDVNGKNGVNVNNITSPKAGIVSYYLDGLENVLLPENLNKIDIVDVWRKSAGQIESVPAGKQVQGGEAVSKVVNNLSPMYIVGEIPADKVPLQKLKSSGQLLVQFEQGSEKPIFLDIVEVVQSGKKIRLILESNNFSGDFLGKRVYNCSIITERFEGYIVPAESIVHKDGKPGLYTIYKNTVKWQAVKIQGQIGEKIALLGLDPDTSYVENPKYTEEGQVIQ